MLSELCKPAGCLKWQLQQYVEPDTLLVLGQPALRSSESQFLKPQILHPHHSGGPLDLCTPEAVKVVGQPVPGACQRVELHQP